MLLRSKRDNADEILDEPLPEPSDQVTREDVFPEEGPGAPRGDGFEAGDRDEEDDREEPEGLLASLPGPLLAAASFVPTFLAVFFGLSYLLSGVTPVARTAAAPAASTVAPFTSERGAPTVPPPLSEAVRDPFVPPRLPDPPIPGSTEPGSDGARSAVEPDAPSLPPVPPRVAVQRGVTPTPAPKPAAPAAARNGEQGWTPAAAFTDREAAGRLAGSIKQQGYPVEIRQDPSSSRPWVVWIGSQPSGGARRR
ncbi:MAG TPA: hypothetical protein VIE41_01455 [Methylomirabilota bacterium]|jgi:hypothetical protein